MSKQSVDTRQAISAVEEALTHLVYIQTYPGSDEAADRLDIAVEKLSHVANLLDRSYAGLFNQEMEELDFRRNRWVTDEGEGDAPWEAGTDDE